LLVEGADVGREPLLAEVLRQLERRYLAFRANPDPGHGPVSSGLHAEYRALCGTLGRPVRAELPGGRYVSGRAEDVDADGRLLVREADATSLTPVSAGDIIHLR
jgi:BirA family biotin operon repressor/biotin-[acetyl-CoA-carboxylase] ligase